MNIQEAVKQAMENGCYIFRKFIDNELSYHPTRIKPSNSYGTCIIYTFDVKGNEISHCKNWNPTADDLMADDWELVAIRKELQAINKNLEPQKTEIKGITVDLTNYPTQGTSRREVRKKDDRNGISPKTRGKAQDPPGDA